jgi:hypothetical protein
VTEVTFKDHIVSACCAIPLFFAAEGKRIGISVSCNDSNLTTRWSMNEPVHLPFAMFLEACSKSNGLRHT